MARTHSVAAPPLPSSGMCRADLAVRGDGAPHYRIPALAVTERGTVLAAYDARPTLGVLPSKIAIMLRRSTDEGRTWGAPIVVRRGPHAGRLLPQYVVRFEGETWAASAHSDDHGASWRMGALVGPGADENKVVELADGRLMLNSRAKPHRRIAFSNDDGDTWTGWRVEPQLIDPANNGSIVRSASKSPPDAPERHWLLFSNTDGMSERRNLVVRMSCDDGATWRIGRVEERRTGAATVISMDRQTSQRRGQVLAILWLVAGQPCGAVPGFSGPPW